MNDSSTETQGGSASNTYLLVPILLLFLLLIIAVLRSPNLVSSAGIGSAVIVMTPLVLATYSLMALAMAGRGTVDLSVGPLMGFVNVTLVVLNGLGALESPLLFFLYAIAVGVAYQLLMGLIIVYVRVQPIIVALSGVVGRFIYRPVNQGLRGEEIGLQELQVFAGQHRDDAHRHQQRRDGDRIDQRRQRHAQHERRHQSHAQNRQRHGQRPAAAEAEERD